MSGSSMSKTGRWSEAVILSSLLITPSAVSVGISPDDESGTETFLLSPGEWKRLNRSLGYDPDAGLSLSEGQPLDEAEYEAVRRAHLRTAAVRDAANLLSFSGRSRAALLNRLKQRGHPPEAAEYAVSFLEKKGILNDAEACADYARTAVRTKRCGKLRIEAYLCSRGFAREDAEAAARAVPEEEYREALLWQIRKKTPLFSSGDAAPSADDRRKAYAALMRQGFTAGEIRDALDLLKKS